MAAKDSRLQLVIGFVLLGAILIGVSFYYSTNRHSGPFFDTRVAQVTRDTGKVFIFRSGVDTKEVLSHRTGLYSLDSIETSEDGSAYVTTEAGDRILVIGNSLITFEKLEEPESGSLLVVLKRGDIRMESVAKAGELIVAKNGKRLAADDYGKSSLAQEVTQVQTPVDSFSSVRDEAQGLSEAEITNTLNNQKGFFFKCYTQLLQKDPAVKGQVSLSFTVESTGKLSVAEVTASTIESRDFKDCLLEVLKRVEFKAFRGSPVSTLFPLKFE